VIDAQLKLQPDASRYTLPRFLDDVCARHGERLAIRSAGQELRYAQLRSEVRQLARGLAARGVVKGARVALLMANRPEWVSAAFAVSLLGGVLVPVNTFAPPEERDYILRHGDASVLLLQRELLKHRFLEELLSAHREIAAAAPGALRCPALPSLRSLFVLGSTAPQGAAEPWSALEAAAEEIPEPLLDALASEVTPSDEALIIYTSGTTSRPKGVLHMQRAPVIQSWRFAEYMGLGPDDRIYTAQPFFWTAGLCMSLGATLAAGGTLLLQEHFEPGAALDCIEQERATAVHAWPHQQKSMAEHPSAAGRDLGCVKRIEFSSPLAPLAGIEKDEWGTFGAYGLSETFTVAAMLPSWAPAELRKRTSGEPLPGMSFRIVDPKSGVPLGPGEKGEIAVKGLTFMRGYYKVEPERVVDADGFFHTKDAGRFDDHGLLHWSGRLSNLIKTGGANVSPLEIEEALRRYPGLKTAHAVGVPHPTLGEAIVLCAISVKTGADPDPQAIRAFLRERLAAYKVPKVVLAFQPEEVGYTGNQKLQLAPLREKALEKLAAAGIEIEGHSYGSTGT